MTEIVENPAAQQPDGFLAGARDNLPMLLGAAPFGLIFGTLAGPSGLPPWAALAMSLFVFAGSAQFIAVTLMAAGASPLVIVATTFIVNIRHALYSASLLPYVAGLPRHWRALMAFVLTDETFAVVYNRLQSAAPVDVRSYYLGAGLAMYGNWIAWTAVGIVLGQTVPGIEHWGLEFAMVATFVGIVVPLLKNRAQVAAALAAGLTALCTTALPYKLGLLAAVLAGIAVGMLLEPTVKQEAA
ncbi:4-azaleucine resistance probable transporter AzlC [Andreprevotia lacus DSM 23236]|jgi:4-azaleucine resistance transporter AzlC|uniref:4-azaleucine resistance probable transporter AzlC n=1 Tax=Andreprevotia lacus DSM 23236 TaxID=1121001 RepID=A0A1W1Y0Q7_9NEIS|nr:AzlC family ABC transporter permease [Andreprevotia lacus]SMC29779.1 4-azaleucine resistance probable transporter AzlC [Andreprevotia lacus DSM 23236]